MAFDPAVDEAIAVVVGSFNPAIFGPDWLLARKLIGEEQAEDREIGVIHPQIAQFRVGWLSLEVTQVRLRASTSDPASAVLVRDLVIGILATLEHTPVTKVGINRFLHFQTGSNETWHRIGHTLVPKRPFEGLLDDPGTLSVTVQGKRPQSPAMYVTIKVEPSNVVSHGVFFEFNEHFEAEHGRSESAFVREVLLPQWDLAQDHFLAAARAVLTRTGGV